MSFLFNMIYQKTKKKKKTRLSNKNYIDLIWFLDFSFYVLHYLLQHAVDSFLYYFFFLFTHPTNCRCISSLKYTSCFAVFYGGKQNFRSAHTGWAGGRGGGERPSNLNFRRFHPRLEGTASLFIYLLSKQPAVFANNREKKIKKKKIVTNLSSSCIEPGWNRY